MMFDGLAQRVDPKSDSLSLLQFDKIGYDLSEFVSDPTQRKRKASEFFFYDLIWPKNPELSERDYGKYISEGHEQLSSPLYGFAIVVVAAAVMLHGSFNRRGYIPRMIAAAPLAASVLAVWILSRGRFRSSTQVNPA